MPILADLFGVAFFEDNEGGVTPIIDLRFGFDGGVAIDCDRWI